MYRPAAAALFLLLALAGAGAEHPGETAETPREVLHTVWAALEENLYDEARARARLTPAAYGKLAAAAAQAEDLEAFAPALRAFVGGLGVSHTRFLTDREIDFHFFRSLFGTRDPDLPVVCHAGAQFLAHGDRYRVRALLDGYPAARAGLRRGDAVLRAGGRAFDPWSAFNGRPGPVALEVERNGELREVVLEPVCENPRRSFIEASRRSARSIAAGRCRLGYYHLWLGTDPETASALEDAVVRRFAGHDGVILDLRGGFGGAWHRHLDPFFADRSGFFRATVRGRDGAEQALVTEPGPGGPHYAGPLVVLIDAGVRSGKEALAWQFRRSGRAELVGTPTAGAFTAGRGMFFDGATRFGLYVAVSEYFLDGERLEGVGVAPDHRVPYPLERSPAEDPQLAFAVRLLGERLGCGQERGGRRRGDEDAHRAPVSPAGIDLPVPGP